jgi:hypothetical protein
LPNITNLPNENKTLLKTILQTTCEGEVLIEKQLHGNTKANMIECSNDISEQVIEILCKKTNNEQQEQYEHSQEQGPGHTQCAQQ